MDPTDATRSRRRVLSLIAGTGTVALAGCTADLSSRRSTPTTETATTIGPETDGLTDDERERYVDRMAER